jgi:hypothetical protein
LGVYVAYADGTPMEHDGDQVFAVEPCHVVDESL